MKNIYLFIIIFSIYKSCAWFYFFQIMVIEILLNNEIQIFFPNQSIFLKGKISNCAHYWKKIKIKFLSCHMDTILIMVHLHMNISMLLN
jgi:hypothetical protein